MKTSLQIPFIAILMASSGIIATNAFADDDFKPADFLAKNCSSCHSDVVYSRPDHRMQDLKQLEAQVRRCDANVGTGLFDEDIEILVKHLNSTYYNF